MDARQFDALTRSIASATSRRSVIKTLVAAAVVGASRLRQGAAPAPASAATCRALGEACKPGATGTETGACCAQNADGTSSHLVCGKIAQAGAFRCACDTTGGYARCGDACVSVSNCPTGAHLNATTCTCVCPTGTIACDGACVSDQCPGGQAFDATTCTCPADQCPPCGLRGEVQAPDCSCACPTGTIACDGACVTDSCPPSQILDPTTCTCGCQVIEVFCGGVCVNPLTVCQGLHNKVFNIECCNQGANACQNPGQPSGQCKA